MPIGRSSAANPGLAIVSLFFLCQLPGFSQPALEPHEEHAQHARLLIRCVYNYHEGRWMPGLGAEYEYILPSSNRLLAIGIAGDDIHLMLGAHIGFGFWEA